MINRSISLSAIVLAMLAAPVGAQFVMDPADVPEGIPVPAASVYLSNVGIETPVVDPTQTDPTQVDPTQTDPAQVDPTCSSRAYRMLNQPGANSRAYASQSTPAGCATSMVFDQGSTFTAGSDFELNLVLGCVRDLVGIGFPLVHPSLVVDVYHDGGVTTVAHEEPFHCEAAAPSALPSIPPITLPVQGKSFDGGVMRIDVTPYVVNTNNGDLPVPLQSLSQTRNLYFVTGDQGTSITGQGLHGHIDDLLPYGGVTHDFAEVPQQDDTLPPVKTTLRPWFWLPGADSSMSLEDNLDALMPFWQLRVVGDGMDAVVAGSHDGFIVSCPDVPEALGATLCRGPAAATHSANPTDLREKKPGTYGIELVMADPLRDEAGEFVRDGSDQVQPDPSRINIFRTTIEIPDGPAFLQFPDAVDDVQHSDDDGIPDHLDSCPAVTNPGQSDFDRDGIGDACDPDKDGDNVRDDLDNCLDLVNDQSDVDRDGLGDACDADIDGDGILNDSDNCPSAANVGQLDEDGNGVGDMCQDDLDGDGVVNADDNCPQLRNQNQLDLDADGAGDACDLDIDGDKLPDTLDNCPLHHNAQQADLDGDGIGDVCDTDVDGDGRVDQAIPAAFGAPEEVDVEQLLEVDERQIPGFGFVGVLALLGAVLVRRN